MFKTRMVGSRVDVDSRKATAFSRLLLAFDNGGVLHLCVHPDLSEDLWVDHQTYPEDLKILLNILSKRNEIGRSHIGARLVSTLEYGGEVKLEVVAIAPIAGWKTLESMGVFPLKPGLLAVHPFSTEANEHLIPHAYRM